MDGFPVGGWSAGLLVCWSASVGVPPPPPKKTLGGVSFQFFRKNPENGRFARELVGRLSNEKFREEKKWQAQQLGERTQEREMLRGVL